MNERNVNILHSSTMIGENNEISISLHLATFTVIVTILYTYFTILCLLYLSHISAIINSITLSSCPPLHSIPWGYQRKLGVCWNHTPVVLPAHALKYVIATIGLSGRIPQGDVRSTRVVDWGTWRVSRLGKCPSALLENWAARWLTAFVFRKHAKNIRSHYFGA
jgi:hypothetical protein